MSETKRSPGQKPNPQPATVTPQQTAASSSNPVETLQAVRESLAQLDVSASDPNDVKRLLQVTSAVQSELTILRRESCRQALKSGLTLRAVARGVGVSHSTVRLWLLAEAGGQNSELLPSPDRAVGA